MARLVWRQNGGGKKEFVLGDSVILGREADATCQLESRSVSRHHARVERRDQDFFISDLGSTNGTFVNGARVSGETRLSPGDTVLLGDEFLEFDLEGGPAVTRSTATTEPLARGSRASGTLGIPRLPDEVLPRRLGKFYLLQKLGQGGMGTVYHAVDLDSNREVAVKFIRSHIGRNEAFLDFFHNREAVLAREINHPNIITIYEHGVAAEQHYLSMEYVRGENLYQVMKRRQLEPAEVLEILRQVACGLAAAHRQGVVHSDVKPANILLVDETPGSSSGSDEEGAGGSTGDSSGILEFQTEAREGEEAGKPRYEPGLMEEIRRRVGEPSHDVIMDPPYFQRASEWNFIIHYFEKAIEGRGCFLLVEGETGAGKDRIVSEFLRDRKTQADASSEARSGPPVRFYEFDCSRIEGIPLLYEQFFGSKPSGSKGTRILLDDLRTFLAENPAPEVISILSLGSATPLACELILELTHLMSQQGLMLLATLDPEAVRTNDSLKPFLERVSPYTKELYLRPLTEYQIQRYLQQMFTDAVSDRNLPGDLYRLSRGNFGKLLEILRGFFEKGVLSTDHPSGRLLYRPRAQEFELEEGKNFYERYRAFGRVEQRILVQAAFIGPFFLFDTIHKLNDLNETSLFFVIRTLLAAGFFVEQDRSWYSFTNAAFQRYLAESIPLSERPQLHRKISRLLESVPVRESPELHYLRASHLSGCHEFKSAVQHLLEGAHMARNEYRDDLYREMYQEVLKIYRMLGRRESSRKEVVGVLRDWFRRDGNWYEILGELSSDIPKPLVKITDFGISFRLDEEGRDSEANSRKFFGTPRYMAPERTSGEYEGFKSDLFALGIITYEMAVGRPPFPEIKGTDVIEANQEQPITLPAEAARRFPPGMKALLAGLVHKDPLRRWEAERVVREVVKLQFDAKLAR